MSATLPAFVDALGQGVHAIDTGFQRERFDAAYLLVQGGRAAFIDTGTNHAVPRLLQALAALGLTPDAVDFVIPTHVHLDHAGGAGLLMQSLPAATLVVHPRGARHLIAPSALFQGATAVYGAQEMARSYGTLVPVPPERVRRSHDGMRLQLAGRSLLLVDTPGHARHHHCIWDETTRGWFTGDTFGLSYREFDGPRGAWILPTTTPVRFEPEALRESIERLLAQQPACIYLTHFGRVDDVHRLGRLLLDLLAQVVALGQRLRHAPGRHAALKAELTALYLASLAEQQCPLDASTASALLAMDIELNAQGMGIWLDRAERR
ncbi:MAG: MBL fold metallo-hydrolase [Rubrivivax sp.]|nr:MBL fold metallo-hydrolase [Rubrivivax sp.]